MHNVEATEIPGPALGETALHTLLRDLHPTLCPDPYTFCVLSTEVVLPATVRVFATVREEEGLTVVGPKSDIDLAGLSSVGTWARISLDVHSALAAVGLTAVVSSAFTSAGISANVLAGFYHDHFFVPWDRRADALAVLSALSV